MDPLSQTEMHFFRDWAVALSAAGVLCFLIGLLAGWIIWRKSRNVTEKLEERNRNAMAEFERTSDEVSRIKAELKPPGEGGGTAPAP